METNETSRFSFMNPFASQKTNIVWSVILVLGLFILDASFFTINEGEQASAFLFGKSKRDYTNPGLRVKWPWEKVIRVDKRLLLHTAGAMTLQESTKKNILIDYFCLFKVDNPVTYFTKVVSIEKAKDRIDDHLGSDIAALIGKSTFDDVVTNKRQELLDKTKISSNKGLDDIDISIKLLSFNRVELPIENRAAVFGDMIADRNKISKGYLAEGQRIKDSIESGADYAVSQILSTAHRQADSIKGTADAIRLMLLNNAYAKSKELFMLYNEIETFKSAYAKNTEWVLTPDNLFPVK
jgi:membrane protease subunit HflC